MSDLPSNQSYSDLQPQEAEWRVSFYQPPVVLAARATGSPVKGNRTIAYTTISGSYTGIYADMQMYVGSDYGLMDKGRIRVRSADADSILTAENTLIEWADGDYLTVVRYWEPESKFLRGVQPNELADATLYVDYDIEYSDQNSDWLPIVCMGPHQACLPGEDTYWSASGTTVFDSTISSYTWTFGDGTTSSVHTPGIHVYPDAGNYTVSLTATAASGKHYTSHRHVIVGQPAQGVVFDSSTGDRDRGYVTAKLKFYQDVPDYVRDGTLAVIWCEEWFGGIRNPTTPPVVMTGYVRNGSIEYNHIQGFWELTLEGIIGFLQSKESFAAALNQSTSPTLWKQMNAITPAKAIAYYLHWFTTALRCADYRNSIRPVLMKNSDFAKGPITSALKTFVENLRYGKLNSNACGVIWSEVDYNHIPVSVRNPSMTLELTPSRRRDAVRITRNQQAQASQVIAEGVSFVLAGEISTALRSGAPGATPGYVGSMQQSTNLAVGSQDDLNDLAGLHLAELNNEFPDVSVSMAGSWRMFDIAPQQVATLSLAPVETPARLSWVNKQLLVKSVTHKYDVRRRLVLTDVNFVGVTSGPAGEFMPVYTGTTSTPSDDPIPVPDPLLPPVITVPGTDLVYAATAAKIGRTRNWTAASPDWVDTTGVITGVIQDFAVDPWPPGPKQQAMVVTTTGIWSTLNLDDTPPTWVKCSSGPAGVTLDRVACVRYTIAENGVVYVLAIAHSGATYYVYVGCTMTRGGTWTWKQIGITTNASDVHDLEVSQWHSEIVYCSCGNGLLHKSLNAKNAVPTYSSINIGGSKPLANIEFPYAGNSSDLVVLVAGAGVSALIGPFERDYFYNWLGNTTGCFWGTGKFQFLMRCSFNAIYWVVGWYCPTLPAAGTMTIVWSVSSSMPSGYTWVQIVRNRNHTYPIASTTYGVGGLSGIQTTVLAYDNSVGQATDIQFRTQGENGDFDVSVHSISIDGVYYFSDGTGDSIQKSIDGAASFSDITPSTGGATGWRGLHAMYPLDGNLISAFADTGGSSYNLIVSTDGGESWIPSSGNQVGLLSPVAVGRWCYHTHGLYCADSTRWLYSMDDGVTMIDRTGSWESTVGTLINPRNIVPIWIN